MSDSYPKSWWYPLGGALFVVVSVNMFFLYLAITQPDYEIESSPYEKGLRYGETIEELRRAKKLGFVPKFQVEQVEGKGFVISALFNTEKSLPESIDAHVKHLGSMMDNKTIQLSQVEVNATGTLFIADSALPFPGLYQVDLEAKIDGETVKHQERLVIRSEAAKAATQP